MVIAQGTVRDFDSEAGTGSLFLDNGTVLEFGAGAFQAGGLRLLRAGQRVRFDTGADGTVTRITLLTLP
jgi:cold shock CspA family protein